MDDDFDEPPRRKRKGKGFSKKQAGLVLAIIVIFSLGALAQHFVIEPLYGETIEQKYTRCLTQKEVLDERFQSSENELRAVKSQLDQCLG